MLRADHPDPAAVRKMLDALGLEMAVAEGPAPTLHAVIETPKGRVALV